MARTKALGPLVSIALLLSCSAGAVAQQQDFDREAFYCAVEFCRGDVSRPMAISADQELLCFDGRFDKDMDLSSVAKLREGGLFVIRSSGGEIVPAIALSNLLRDRHAIVVVYDYCLSACANYAVIASYQTFVLKGALVAWDYESSDPGYPSCAELRMRKTRDGSFRLQLGSCRPASSDQFACRAALLAEGRFYRERTVDPYFEPPPDNLYVRRTVRNLYRDTDAYHHIMWTLNPRYCQRLFKTKMFYEQYPESPSEVDEMVARLNLKITVIYDP